MNTFRNRKDIKSTWSDLWSGTFWFSDNKIYIAHKKIIRDKEDLIYENVSNQNDRTDKEIDKKSDKYFAEKHLTFKDFYNSTPKNSSPSNTNILELNHEIENKGEKFFYQSDNLDILDIIPNGYIKLFLQNIDVNQIFIKHNITLKYLDINGQKYIKSFILGNESKEIDCYNLGENESLTIKKDNNSIIKIILKEKNDNLTEFSVVNGIVLN